MISFQSGSKLFQAKLEFDITNYPQNLNTPDWNEFVPDWNKIVPLLMYYLMMTKRVVGRI